MPKHIEPEVVQNIIKDYKAGASVQEVADRHGVFHTTVRKKLKAAGILRNARPGRWRSEISDEVRDQIVDLYSQGHGPTVITKKLGLHDPTFIYAVLKQRGVSARLSTGTKSTVGDTNITTDGYVEERVGSDWIFAGKMRGRGGNGLWIPQHRKVMAEHLGRPLLSSEQVHHIDGNRQNNKITNLELRFGAHGSGVRMVCVTCGGSDIQAVPLK